MGEGPQRPVWIPAAGFLASLAWFGYCGWYVRDAVGFGNLAYLLPSELALIVVALFAPPVFLWLLLLYLLRSRTASEELLLVLERFERLDAAPEEQEEKVQAITANLREQVRQIEDAGKSITEAAETSLEALEKRLARLEKLEGELGQRTSTLKAEGDRLALLVREGKSELREQGEVLRKAGEESQTKLRELISETNLSIGRLSEAGEEGLAKARGAGEELAKFSGELTSALERFTSRSETARDAIREDAGVLRESGKVLISGAQEVGRLARSAAEALEAAGRKAETNTAGLQARLGEISKLVETWQAKVETLSVAAAEESGKLSARYESESSRFAAALRQPTHALAGALEELRRRTARLEEAAEKAGQKAEVLGRADLETRTEFFLRGATQALEDLNGTAFDLARLLETEVPRDLLQNFKAGDRGAFARRLSRNNSYFVPEVRRKFEESAEFRRAATRYIARFEDLLSRASNCDPDHTITSTFLTADVGKLYLLLTRSIGARA